MLKVHVGDPYASVRHSFADIVSVGDARPRKLLTLIHVLDDAGKRLLMGHKARGFGAGKWNGFGGKFDPAVDSDIATSACRELEEECALHASPAALRHHAILYFQYPTEPKLFEVHLFSVRLADLPPTRADGTANTPAASEEMNPLQWCTAAEALQLNLWADDAFWLDGFLAANLHGESRVSDSVKVGGGMGLQFAGAFDFRDFTTVVAQRVVHFNDTCE